MSRSEEIKNMTTEDAVRALSEWFTWITHISERAKASWSWMPHRRLDFLRQSSTALATAIPDIHALQRRLAVPWRMRLSTWWYVWRLSVGVVVAGISTGREARHLDVCEVERCPRCRRLKGLT